MFGFTPKSDIQTAYYESSASSWNHLFDNAFDGR
jgi:hypothetical protein